MAIEPLVDAGTAVMRSRAIMESLLGRSVVVAAVRSTVYRQFCAGESVEEVDRAVRDLSRSGLRAILDYGMEDAEDAEACARNLAGFLRTVEMASSMPPTSVSDTCSFSPFFFFFFSFLLFAALLKKNLTL